MIAPMAPQPDVRAQAHHRPFIVTAWVGLTQAQDIAEVQHQRPVSAHERHQNKSDSRMVDSAPHTG